MGRWLRCQTIVWLACLSQLLAACSGAQTPDRAEVILDDVIVTRDAADAPLGCRPVDVARFVVGFLEHLETRPVELERFFAPAERFSWYSATTGDPRGKGDRFWGKELHRLPSYFQERRRQRERMSLKTIFVRSDPASETANVVFELRRTADDLAALGVHHDVATGKGGIDCASDRIIQWSIFQPEQPDGSTTGLCPDPSIPPGNRVVACSPA